MPLLDKQIEDDAILEAYRQASTPVCRDLKLITIHENELRGIIASCLAAMRVGRRLP